MGRNAIEITDSNYEEVVKNSEKPVLIDFWAEWCGPCKMIGPVVEELAEDYAEVAIIGKLDVDAYPDIAGSLGIRSIPTLLFFKGGEIVDRQVGAVPKSVLEDKLKTQIA